MASPSIGFKYQSGDRVFAKLKGYPWWPSKVKERIAGKVEAYKVHFYGTHDEGTVKLDQMMEYNEENNAKFTKKPPRHPKFGAAMQEIEQNLEFTEPNEQNVNADNDDMEEGELLIDEGPPVLIKQTPAAQKSVGNAQKSTPGAPSQKAKTDASEPKSAVRKGGRGGKRDSVSGTSPLISTPVVGNSMLETKQEVATPAASSQPEVVSRSGRKIKPKRFADDFDTSTSSKPEPTSDGPPANKRSKRATSTGTKNMSTEEKVTPVAAQTYGARRSAGSRQAAMIQPQEEVIVRAPLAAEPPSNTSTVSTSRKSTPASKKLKSTEKINQVEVVPATTEVKSAVTKTVTTNKDVQMESVPDEDEGEEPAEAFGNEEFEEENIDELGEEGEEIDDYGDESATRYSFDENENGLRERGEDLEEESELYDEEIEDQDTTQKLPIKAMNGVEVELCLNTNQEHATLKSKATFDIATAKNVVKIKKELEKSKESANEFLQEVLDSAKSKDDELSEFMVAKLTANVHEKIEQLRREGEMIEIVGEIISSVNIRTADCDRAIELLERLANQTVSTFTLKKHPEVVDTIRQLRSYQGNVSDWKFSQEQKAEFEQKADLIRKKSESIYQTFKSLFCSNSNKPFQVVFTNEVKAFNNAVSGMTQKAIFNLSKDPTIGVPAVDELKNESEGSSEVKDEPMDTNMGTEESVETKDEADEPDQLEMEAVEKEFADTAVKMDEVKDEDVKVEEGVDEVNDEDVKVEEGVDDKEKVEEETSDEQDIAESAAAAQLPSEDTNDTTSTLSPAQETATTEEESEN